MYSLKNYMEEIVYDQMKSVLKDIDVCTCDKCSMDIAAIALNELPVKYIVTERGALFSRIDALYAQFEIGVTSAIVRAAQIVQKNPMHDRVKYK